MMLVNIINKDGIGASWKFEGKEINIPFSENGRAIFSEKYNLVVAMNYRRKVFSLDMHVYNLDGSILKKIAPYTVDRLSYGYITKSDRVKSGIVVIADYSDRKDDFYDWQFEVDLDNFIISRVVDRAY